jgi:tellurite resistance protein
MVMGIGGLGQAWRAAGHSYPVLAPVGETIVWLAASLWVLLAAGYLAKWASAPALARAEWEDPVQGAFVAIIPASLLLLMPALAPRMGMGAEALFLMMACAQVAVTAAICARWITAAPDGSVGVPAWQLAVVAGHLFTAGAAAALGYKLTGWCFFGAGVFAWIVIDAFALPRLATLGPLAPGMRPLIAVELVPPTAALIAYNALGEGEADAFALGLFGWALFVAVVLVITWRWLCKAPFGPSYWAFTLPAATLSAAAWRIAHATAAEPALQFALAMFVAANALIGVIAARSIRMLGRGTFLPRQE